MLTNWKECCFQFSIMDLASLLVSRGGRSHFFRLWLRSYSKILESVSGTGYFSNLRIRLLFRLQLQSSIQPWFTHVFTYEMTTQTPVTAEIKKWHRNRFFPNFLIRNRRKNAESCQSWLRTHLCLSATLLVITFSIFSAFFTFARRWATATLLISSLPLFVKFNCGASAPVTE